MNKKAGLDFATVMKAFLRADPDIIMVGEMRDKETTRTGIEASLTGHLVFATLHTNCAPESIIRLLDMGMDPFNFSDALLGILAQRLAKRLCKCKQPYNPDAGRRSSRSCTNTATSCRTPRRSRRTRRRRYENVYQRLGEELRQRQGPVHLLQAGRLRRVRRHRLQGPRAACTSC